MKVQISMSVSGLMEVEVPDDKREALEEFLDENDGPIDVDKFEEVTGIAWDWDDMLNSLDFEIDDVDLPRSGDGEDKKKDDEEEDQT
jgi:hypothetical protein